ncbi:MAG: flagellar hook-basal body complex protein FliE [Thermodesulfobacteriota bacterium]
MAVDISQVSNTIEALKSESGAAKAGQADQSVGNAFQELFDKAADKMKQADQAAVQANTGGPVDLHDVMISMEKADISLRLLVQVRNKAVDAYKEIMRMQV